MPLLREELPPPIEDRVAALETQMADLTARVTAIEGAMLNAGMAVDPAVQELLDRAKQAGEKYK